MVPGVGPPQQRMERRLELKRIRDAAGMDRAAVPNSVDLRTGEWREFYGRK